MDTLPAHMHNAPVQFMYTWSLLVGHNGSLHRKIIFCQERLCVTRIKLLETFILGEFTVSWGREGEREGGREGVSEGESHVFNSKLSESCIWQGGMADQSQEGSCEVI
jgi:hypothetical protein